MAKKGKEEKEEAKGKEKGRKRKKKDGAKKKGEKGRLPFKSLLFLLVPLLLLGGGGFAVWKFVLKKPADEKGEEVLKERAKKAKKRKKGEDNTPLSYLSLEPFVVNLQGSGRRFLKVSITLALTGEKGAELAKKEIPPIRNAVLLLLTNKRFEDVITMKGKEQLQQEIRERINKLLNGTKVKKVYFTEFIAQ